MRFFKTPNFDFIGKRYIFIACSLALIVVGAISLIVKGGPTYGIDFKGGVLVQLKFEKAISSQDVRKALESLKLGNYMIQELGGNEHKEILIRMEQSDLNLEGLGEKIVTALETTFKDSNPQVRRVEMVGAHVGKDLRSKGMWAILYAMLGILIYVTWRFEFKFATAAVIALFHDIFITIGVFSILNKEINLTIVAALLTLAGYSVNDTIVVFDRFRENMRNMRKDSYDKVFNDSINQTLSRTILTSLTTVIAVLALFFLGGEVIHDFAFALTFGIIIGTYSSIFIASPIVYDWHNWEVEYQKKKALAK